MNVIGNYYFNKFLGVFMKMFYASIIMTMSFCILANAQSDTMVITMKNSQIEKIAVSQIQKIKFENITDVRDELSINHNLQLSGNYPNPFAEMTNIDFEITSSGTVSVFIYDNAGTKIQTLKCENCSVGKNSLQWDGFDLNKNKVQGGVYYYEVKFNNETLSKKMILVK